MNSASVCAHPLVCRQADNNGEEKLTGQHRDFHHFSGIPRRVGRRRAYCVRRRKAPHLEQPLAAHERQVLARGEESVISLFHIVRGEAISRVRVPVSRS